jgi:hypothetical protein
LRFGSFAAKDNRVKGLVGSVSGLKRCSRVSGLKRRSREGMVRHG